MTTGSQSRRAPRARRLTAAAAAGVAVASLAACSVDEAPTPAGSASSTTGADASATTKNASCSDPVTVRVSVAPDLQPIVADQARSIADAACAKYVVTADQPATVATRVAAGDPQTDLWIPDSPLWAAQINAKAPGAVKVDDTPIATSPIALAVPSTLPDADKIPTGLQPTTTIMTAAGPKLEVAKPAGSTTSLLLLMTAWINTKSTAEQIIAGKSFLPVAHSSGTDEDLLARALPGAKGGPVIFPASERTMITFNREHSDVQVKALAAQEGLAGLKYVAVTPSKTPQPIAAAGAALVARMHSQMAMDALRDADFRVDGKGKRTVPGFPGDPKVVLDSPTVDQFKEVSAVMARLSAPVRMLLVVDTSGSMAEPSGYGMSRIELVGKSVASALNFIPPNTSGALWQFSNTLTLGAHDWREVAPMTPLSDANGNMTPAALALSNGFDSLAGTIGGGTGLYNTVWDAYQSLQKDASPQSVSILVLLTDGKNEDAPDSITMDQLLGSLKGAQNAAKPVRVILGGIGPDSDMGSLKTIANAVGGQSVSVTDQTSLIDIMAASIVQ